MNPIVAFIRLIRLPNLLIIVLTQYAIRYGIIYPIIFSFSGDQNIDGVGFKMEDWDFFLLSLSTAMIAAAGYIINDYFDVKVDRVNRPDKIIVGKYIKRRVAMGAHLVINAIAILIGAYLAYKIGNWKLIFIQVLSAGALWYYSTLFKKQVAIGNVVVALLAALVPFVAGLYELILQYTFSDDTVNILLFQLEEYTPFEDVEFALIATLKIIMYWVLGFSFFAFISTMIREIIKDIEDYDGDKKYFSNTLAVVYGKEKAKILAQGIGVIMIGLIAYYQYTQLQENPGGEDAVQAKAQTKALITVMYFLFTVQIPLLYVIYKLKLATIKTDYTKLSTSMKFIMLTGIGYTALFYYLIINI
ncbi:MAG: geranylgeranylglycerol-phosphate geranylgeranyltransferase [Flavobacteriales bacterium]|nr:geranylgeranylglycerol-phosphate geranylgeranyltransferase [Flavobacteriales bacterium]NQX97322.1 geranylgeranylglycerol-phosphate geranylgeranyltransferase [Flavobacteriales bacterium]